MDIIIVSAVALVASGLTLFSGFGLGTLLLPAMLIVLPPQAAVAATAIVHFANNLLKVALFGRHCRMDVLIRFGGVAVVAAFFGAQLLMRLAQLPPIGSYTLAGNEIEIVQVTFVISVLIFGFAIFDLSPAKKRTEFGPHLLPVGGFISGFLGGLSGHQGAMRSAFLASSGLTKEAFIGTGVTVACMVDVTRIIVYGLHLSSFTNENLPLMVAACISAFFGVFLGQKLLKKVTMEQIRELVGVGLILLSIALGSGLLSSS
ncbi:MAG: sulfite exporter TauE/SafE family protein [Candidatus Neomarinimicrobiota bacterium]|nr:sulfite exporter TauE/SafE family protein [Candidatus Neomarinimicrobiota bacterium]